MINKLISRPVLALVISILIVLLGVIAMLQVPMTQFPSIAPPEVNVTVEYTGANAETVTKSAIVPLERAINGVPGMKYMSSDAGNDGVGVVQVLFETGTDPDIAAVNVQNRVASVMGELPVEVTRNGVKIAKEENAMLMYLNIFSTDTSLDEKFLYNFVDINILAELKRIQGVGYADILGAKEYAMRVWLNPDRLRAYNVGVDEVLNALESQNIEAAPGKVGESTGRKGQSLQYVLKYPGKFNTVAQYEQIPIRTTSSGQVLRIKDIAEVTFETTYYDVVSKYNGQPCAAIMLKQLPGSNATKVITDVKSKMEELRLKNFISGMDYEISYDVSRFLEASIDEVIRTFIEAFVLVALVVFLFLQDFRSTLIPAIAVPVSLVGTFVFIYLFGFSANLITLFSLVLAIGIVVDDAIVVVEAVHAKMHQHNMSPLHATRAAMQDISGAVMAITLVMSAVFIPVAFLPGPIGVFYKQFSVTMAVAIILSGVCALTLAPALSALLLKHHQPQGIRQSRLQKFFLKFNRWYDRLNQNYRYSLLRFVSRPFRVVGMLIFFVGIMTLLFYQLPTGFIPNEDQGTFYVSVTTPPGATLERTQEVTDEIQAIAQQLPEVRSVSTLAGTNILSDGTGATYGTCLVNLKDWAERDKSVDEVIAHLENQISHIKGAQIEMFPPPAVPGFGNASGFELRLLDKTGTSDFAKMQGVVQQFISDLRSQPQIASAFSIFDASYPQYTLELDYDKAAKLGVSVDDALGTLQTLLGSEYATNFIRFGQMYKVMVQALPQYRSKPEDVLQLFVKNELGELVPFSSFVTLHKSYGVDQITRYNMYPSAELNGEANLDYSSGEAIDAIQKVAQEKLPRGYDIDWAGMTRDEVSAGNSAVYIFLLCLVFVYLILSAQYESFLLPFSVILSLPSGIAGAYMLLWILGIENNIYAQVAMVMLIGLLGKNAILIVEYAILKQKEGWSPFKAAVQGAGARLRPILMTSFAFIAGLIPLILASGAGAIGNRTIGSAAAGGMLFGTLFGVFVVPGLYAMFAQLQQMLIKSKMHRSH